MMEIIGFLALFAMGLYFFIAGISGSVLSGAFGGKAPWQFTAFIVIGVCLMALAVYNAPFTVALKNSAAIANELKTSG